MYTTLSTRLYIEKTATGGEQVSQPVSMEGANAVAQDVTLYNGSLGANTFKLQIEGSNDLENWVPLGSTLDIVNGDIPSYQTTGDSAVVGDVGTAYVRVRYDVSGLSTGNNVVLSTGIYTFHQ